MVITFADRDTRIGPDEDMSNFRTCSMMFDCPRVGAV